ncbi:cytochrome c [Pigmentiphaga soli]|uniref:Cytochrome c n=1 Tax=Pigmentiphaga soli TaxID=1007095 RepID=A0ABP8HKH6_9BURK
MKPFLRRSIPALAAAAVIVAVAATGHAQPTSGSQPIAVGRALPNVSLPPHVPPATPTPDPDLPASAGKDVLQGAYLARIGDCTACHTARNGALFAGGLPLASPIGTIYSTNITPDKEHGIGDWSYDDFARLMRRGISKDGHTVYPAMPYPSYSRLTDDDLRALYAYFMQGVKPVAQANKKNDIPWPLSMRWPLGIWRTLFAPRPEPFAGDAGADAQMLRGAYLVQGLGHCGSCHTPRSFTMKERALTDRDGTAYLAGGQIVDGWTAPSLRNEHGGGLGDWNEAEIVEFLKTGRNGRTASFGAMNEVVHDSFQYLTDTDLAAVAKYLKSLAPANNAAPYRYDPAVAQQLYEGHPASTGAQLYLDRCAACHRSNGTGNGKAFPALAGNPILQTADPTSAIHIVLSGSSQPYTEAAPSMLTMAPYADILSDQQIADVVTFIQQSWGNRGGTATADQVAKVRKTATPVEAPPPVGRRGDRP